MGRSAGGLRGVVSGSGDQPIALSLGERAILINSTLLPTGEGYPFILTPQANCQLPTAYCPSAYLPTASNAGFSVQACSLASAINCGASKPSGKMTQSQSLGESSAT